MNQRTRIFAIALLALPLNAFAWGERGHHIICEIAAQLTAERGLNEFLKSRTHTMGHLCNVPDIYWRNLGAVTKVGDAGHYLDPENLGFTISNLPTDRDELIKKTPTEKRATLFDNLGSLWWRADQFSRLAIQFGKKAKGADLPSTKDRQNFEHPYNSAVNSMVSYMGVMGHFFGDASMPYHNTIDFDGWKTGHGGIHSFYETDVVNELDITLIEEVLLDAKLLRRRQGKGTQSTLSLIRNVSVESYPEKKKIEQADRILEPSQITTRDGVETKVPAKRPPAREMAKKLKSLVVGELARSAVALAESWDLIYQKAGRPDLSAYKSYQYPLTPDFVAPDYLTAPAPTMAPSK